VLCRPESVDLVPAIANRIVTSLPAAIEANPQVAIVANAAPFHVPTAQRLAEIGCHILVEKPLADRLDGIEHLIATCGMMQRVLMVGYTLRFSPSLREMVRLVSKGAVGRVLHVAAEIGQYLPDWRPDADYREGVTARAELGGGAVFELSHEIDIALWLGGRVTAVTASMGRVSDLGIDTEDVADLMLEFESGARASIHLDLLQRIPFRRTRVVGSLGTLEWDGISDTLRLGLPELGWRLLHTPALEQRNGLYLSELEHFLACVDGRVDPIVSADVARQVLTIALAAKQSAVTRKTVAIHV